ncbi:MAG: hypothetical protein FWF29_02370, partial [Treponema sp.]|nr:hypothetical protein [Treponema sp.]
MKKKETQQTKTTFNQKVNDFFQKRRTPVLISLIVIAAVFIGFLGFYGISNVMHKNANGKLDVLSGRYDDLKSEITADTSSDKVDTLIKDL